MVDIRHQLTIAQPLWHSQLMVDKNDLRAAFSSRLHEALDDSGIRTRGRGVDVHKQLKNLGIHKTTQAISKWLNGEAIAEADTLNVLSSWLNVRREWLEYGVPPKNGSAWLNTSAEKQLGPNSASSHRAEKVPMISWIQAALWGSAPSNTLLDGTERWLFCPLPISPSGYALIVKGDSMINPGPGRSYPASTILFVDPEVPFKAGDRVIAKVETTDEATFKVYAEDAGRIYLRSINPQYPIIDITNAPQICGKVVGSFYPE